MASDAAKSTNAYAAQAPDSGLAPWQFEPREPRPDDVSIEILYCGVCHSDIHLRIHHISFYSDPIYY